MGVPSFYRWLSEKYPLVVKNVIEALVDPEVPVPIDSTQANPNGMEFGTDQCILFCAIDVRAGG